MAKATYQITALDDFTESINMLVYSDPGAGKTVLGGTARNALIVSCEPGTISAKRLGSKAHTVRIRNFKEFGAFLNDLRRGQVTNPDTDEPYSWIVIDTLTELQGMMMRDILDTAHAANAARDLDTPAIQDYGKHQGLFKRVVHALNDVEENVLYLCHAMRHEDEDGEPIVLPDIAGKNGTQDPTTMSRWVSGTVHAYGYLKVNTNSEKEEYRRLICKRSGPYFGKDRYGVLTPWVDRPNMTEIEARITNPTPATKKSKKEN